MNTKKQYTIDLTVDELKRISSMFKQSSKFYKGVVKSLSISYKLSMFFNKDTTYVKKLDDGNYSLHFDIENPDLLSILPQDKRRKIIKESEEMIITNDEFFEIISKYNIWIVGNKLKSTDKNTLEQFYNKFLFV